MAKRKNNTLSRKTRNRPYRAVYWVSAEGKTEKDYFKMDVCCRPWAYSRHPSTHARMASISMLRPPQRVGADKAVFGLDSILQFVVERFGKLGGRSRRRRQCLWVWCPSVYRRDSAFVGLNAQWLVL